MLRAMPSSLTSLIVVTQVEWMNIEMTDFPPNLETFKSQSNGSALGFVNSARILTKLPRSITRLKIGYSEPMHPHILALLPPKIRRVSFQLNRRGGSQRDSNTADTVKAIREHGSWAPVSQWVNGIPVPKLPETLTRLDGYVFNGTDILPTSEYGTPTRDPNPKYEQWPDMTGTAEDHLLVIARALPKSLQHIRIASSHWPDEFMTSLPEHLTSFWVDRSQTRLPPSCHQLTLLPRYLTKLEVYTGGITAIPAAMTVEDIARLPRTLTSLSIRSSLVLDPLATYLASLSLSSPSSSQGATSSNARDSRSTNEAKEAMKKIWPPLEKNIETMLNPVTASDKAMAAELMERASISLELSKEIPNWTAKLPRELRSLILPQFPIIGSDFQSLPTSLSYIHLNYAFKVRAEHVRQLPPNLRSFNFHVHLEPNHGISPSDFPNSLNYIVSNREITRIYLRTRALYNNLRSIPIQTPDPRILAQLKPSFSYHNKEFW